jgi:hypothetical protein
MVIEPFFLKVTYWHFVLTIRFPVFNLFAELAGGAVLVVAFCIFS